MNQTTTTSNQPEQTALPLQNNQKGPLKTKSTFRTFKIEFNEALKELKKCNIARIDGNEFSCKTVINYLTGCNFEEVFKIFLTDENEERQAFTCRETSECFQRTCVKKNNREFTMDCFYLEDTVEGAKDKTKPFMKVHRINGGCCPDRAIIDILDGEGDKIGYVKEEPVLEGHIASIYDKRNVPMYEIRSEKPRINRTNGENCLYVCCCCGCCGLAGRDKKYEQLSPQQENNFKIMRKNEQVGEIKYPCKIEFWNIEEPIDKFLIIMSRVFMVYFLDRSDTFAEKAFDGGKNYGKNFLRCCCPCCGCC